MVLRLILMPILLLSGMVFSAMTVGASPNWSAHPALAGSLAGCSASRVHVEGYHGKTFALRGVPWIETPSKAVLGFLFFRPPHAGGRAATMRAGGTMPNGANTKILWVIVKPGGTNRLTMRGVKVDGPGSMKETVTGSAGAGGNYPSIVTIPTAGWWRLSLHSGTVSGVVTLPVLPAGS